MSENTQNWIDGTPRNFLLDIAYDEYKRINEEYTGMYNRIYASLGVMTAVITFIIDVCNKYNLIKLNGLVSLEKIAVGLIVLSFIVSYILMFKCYIGKKTEILNVSDFQFPMEENKTVLETQKRLISAIAECNKKNIKAKTEKQKLFDFSIIAFVSGVIGLIAFGVWEAVK